VVIGARELRVIIGEVDAVRSDVSARVGDSAGVTGSGAASAITFTRVIEVLMLRPTASTRAPGAARLRFDLLAGVPGTDRDDSVVILATFVLILLVVILFTIVVGLVRIEFVVELVRIEFVVVGVLARRKRRRGCGNLLLPTLDGDGIQPTGALVAAREGIVEAYAGGTNEECCGNYRGGDDGFVSLHLSGSLVCGDHAGPVIYKPG
jgi:hypothetical protein